MTYSYSNRVTTVKLFGLVRLLRIWRASVYKLVVKEMLIFCLLYAAASLIYRFGLKTSRQQKMFEKIVVYSATFEGILPVTVTFVLGFYVSVVVQRWWSQFMHIPWPDRIMSYISTLIPGTDEATTMIRRTIMRYLLLAEVLLLMTVSAPIKRRFPTVESLVEQGLMTKAEAEIYNSDDVPKLSTKFWIPTEWCAMLFGRARKEKKIKDSFTLSILLNELSSYKTCLYTIFFYDWISLPLVYTQVATVAVYGLYFNTIMSRQYINGTSVAQEFGKQVAAKYSVDLYVPLDALLQLFFYLGWLKVAEQMMNPLGEDDDDFECNFIIDRNLKVAMFAVDRMQKMEPPVVKDAWWQNADPQLNYTRATEKFAMNGWFGSTANLNVQHEQPLSTVLPEIPESCSPPADDVDGGGSNPGSSTHSVTQDANAPCSPGVKEARRRSTRMSTDLGILHGGRRRGEKRAGDSQPGSPEPKDPSQASPFQFSSGAGLHQQQPQVPHMMEIGEVRFPKRGGSGGGGGGGGSRDEIKEAAMALLADRK